MRDVRLIASDMDHTLLDEQGELPPGIDSYVSRLHAAGITFVAASGRPLNRLQQMFPPRDGIAYIGNNGGDFYNARRIVNGTDHAGEIAGMAQRLLAAMN